MALELVSVVIPAYNAQSFIAETLQSLLAQTYRAVEIIVVDDGSSDGTDAVIQSFGSAVRAVRIPNSGVGAARNVGAALATGEWLAFCDSDDLYFPAKLEKQMALARASGVDYVTCDYAGFSARGFDARSHFSYAPPDFWGPVQSFGALGFVARDCLLGRMARFQPNNTGSPVMRRSFFESIGRWDEGLRYSSAEDTDFHFRAYIRQQVAVVPEVLWGYRRHPAQWTADTLQALLQTVEMWERIVSVYPQAQAHAADIQSGIDGLRLELVHDAFHQRRFELAREQARLLPHISLGLRLKLAASRFSPSIHAASSLRRAVRSVIQP